MIACSGLELHDPSLSRRRLMVRAGQVAGAAALLSGCGRLARADAGRLVIALGREPTQLTSAFAPDNSINISGKMFDGLLAYDFDMRPYGQLAREWTVAPDGLTMAFRLRDDVRWHDGRPFTARDVAFSLSQIWKVKHSRGRSTFRAVDDVTAPDPTTVRLHLSRPAPYILSALTGTESQIVPAHLYEGMDFIGNRFNAAPVGTGPYRFVRWERGAYVAMERNPDYWDRSHHGAQQVIFRFLPDAASIAMAMEIGEIDAVTSLALPAVDVVRLTSLSDIRTDDRGGSYSAPIFAFEFNLDRPIFRDPRVRHAIAHAIDKDFILGKIWRGYGRVAQSPLSSRMRAFHSADVPQYPFDPARARALLDAAGYPVKADGYRFSIHHDPMVGADMYQKSADYIRSALADVGIRLIVRQQDFATFVKRVFTDRDFDTAGSYAATGPDPVIGAQRFYWSKAFKPGVAFANAPHYASAAVDAALEAGATATDPDERRRHYVRFQQLVQADLPRIPLIESYEAILSNRRVVDLITTADGMRGNMAAAHKVDR